LCPVNADSASAALLSPCFKDQTPSVSGERLDALAPVESLQAGGEVGEAAKPIHHSGAADPDIYFGMFDHGGRQFEPVYKALVDALEAEGHVIPTAHLAEPGMTEEASLSPRHVYERDTAWIRDCDALIAEVSVPSHGVGYEIGYALGEGKPVLCLCREGLRLSKMISGNPHPGLQVKSYNHVDEAIVMATEFLVTN
jgi:hypothetical protein